MTEVAPWVPPFFTCGECGGEIGRYPVTNLLSQQILDWRHRTIPAGATEHRAVLGTMAHTPRIPEAKPATTDDAGVVFPAPPPEMPARPALRDDLPGPALRLDKLAGENGWEVEAWIMRGMLMDVRWKPNRILTSVVIRLQRDGHQLVATWSTKPWRGVPFEEFIEWDFDGAWSLTRTVEPLGGRELNRAVKYPRAICEACGEIPARHHWTKWGPVCHSDFITPTKEAPSCSTQ